MSNSKKHRGSAALPLYMGYARPRHNPADQGSLLMKAISAAVVVAAAVATGVAHMARECVVSTVVRVLATAVTMLLSFAEDNKLALLNISFCTPNSGVSYMFQSANRSRGQ